MLACQIFSEPSTSLCSSLDFLSSRARAYARDLKFWSSRARAFRKICISPTNQRKKVELLYCYCFSNRISMFKFSFIEKKYTFVRTNTYIYNTKKFDGVNSPMLPVKWSLGGREVELQDFCIAFKRHWLIYLSFTFREWLSWSYLIWFELRGIF